MLSVYIRGQYLRLGKINTLPIVYIPFHRTFINKKLLLTALIISID